MQAFPSEILNSMGMKTSPNTHILVQHCEIGEHRPKTTKEGKAVDVNVKSAFFLVLLF